MFSWNPCGLARHGGYLLLCMLARAGAQAASVLLLARSLGVDGYGQFVAVVAAASFVTPFVGLGLSNIVLRNGARDPEGLPLYQARALRVWWLTLPPGIMVALLLLYLLLPDGFPKMAAFGAVVAELLVTSLVDLRARYEQAARRMAAFGAINAGLPLARLAALLILAGFARETTVEGVLWVYAAAGLVYGFVIWVPSVAPGCIDSPGKEIPLLEGIPFSLAGFAMRLQAEFNKPVLAHFGFGLAGSYNAAQRVADLANMAPSALQESLWPRLYAKHATAREMRWAGGGLMVLALACSASIWIAAPILPILLGDEFNSVVAIARSLTLLPLLQSARSLLNFNVIRVGRVALIGWACGLGAAVSVAGVMLLVPTLGIVGAVAATYAAEGTMLVVLLAGGLYFRRAGI